MSCPRSRVFVLSPGMPRRLANSLASMCILMAINPVDHSPASCFISRPTRSVKGHPSGHRPRYPSEYPSRCNQPFCASLDSAHSTREGLCRGVARCYYPPGRRSLRALFPPGLPQQRHIDSCAAFFVRSSIAEKQI